MSGVGRALKTLRVSAGVKQREFARRVGVTQPYLSAVETGKRVPSLGLLERAALELGVPVRALLSFDVRTENVPPHLQEVFGKIRELQDLLMEHLAQDSEGGGPGAGSRRD